MNKCSHNAAEGVCYICWANSPTIIIKSQDQLLDIDEVPLQVDGYISIDPSIREQLNRIEDMLKILINLQVK